MEKNDDPLWLCHHPRVLVISSSLWMNHNHTSGSLHLQTRLTELVGSVGAECLPAQTASLVRNKDHHRLWLIFFLWQWEMILLPPKLVGFLLTVHLNRSRFQLGQRADSSPFRVSVSTVGHFVPLKVAANLFGHKWAKFPHKSRFLWTWLGWHSGTLCCPIKKKEEKKRRHSEFFGYTSSGLCSTLIPKLCATARLSQCVKWLESCSQTLLTSLGHPVFSPNLPTSVTCCVSASLFARRQWLRCGKRSDDDLHPPSAFHQSLPPRPPRQRN